MPLPTTMTGHSLPEFSDLPEKQKARLAMSGILLLAAVTSHAGPMMGPGDIALRHDIRLLADHGVITGPVSGWPLAWGTVMADLVRVGRDADLPSDVRDALFRVTERGHWETGVDEVRYNAKVGLAAKPNRIRSFQNNPREEAELSLGISWTGEFFSADLNGQAVAGPDDDKEFRYDNSLLGVAVGNYAITLSTMDRWWGPGWDGSLILSNNARPIPSVTLERNFTDPFATKWLSWLGPWDFSVLFGQMESDRHVPNAKFFGLRFDFRPIPTLEIGLARTAQWCGDGRPCGLDTFTDLFFGRDNRGDAGIDLENEPGNQLAGIDFRWSMTGLGLPMGIYGQFTGEDEAGGFPSRYLALGGMDASGEVGDRWSWRGYAEGAYTKCNFYDSDDGFNCAYNHDIYQTGYRYRGRSVGHVADNDSLILSMGLLLIDRDESQWHALLRYVELNRGGPPDERNSLTPTMQTVASVDLMHSRVFRFGVIELGAGFEQLDDEISGESHSTGRGYLQWRSAY